MKNWTVMNDLQQAFNQITTFNFLLDQLQEAVDSDDRQKIVDITHALNAFYHPYCNNWDKKFDIAWKEIIGPPLDTNRWTDYWNEQVSEIEDAISKED